MKKRVGMVFLFLVLSMPLLAGKITSLSQLFVLDKGLLDRDLDDLPDSVDLSIIIPDIPTPEEIALAADISARANFESLAVDFSLVMKESRFITTSEPRNAILIGNRLHVIGQQGMGGSQPNPPLTDHQGLIQIFSNEQRSGITLLAGSQQALLKTGRAFFLRWPYLWDITGEIQAPPTSKWKRMLKIFSAGQEWMTSALPSRALCMISRTLKRHMNLWTD